jgi:transposase
MIPTRKTYTREFKLEALRLWQTTDMSATDVEEDLDISRGMLYKWKAKLTADGKEAFPGQGRLSPEAERIRKLERENEILRQERDILKKAGRHSHAIFSHPKR